MSNKQPDERQQYIFVLKICLVVYVLAFGVFSLLEPDDFYYGRLKFMLYLMAAALVFTVVRILQLTREKKGRK